MIKVKLGMRSLKTAISATLCAIVYMLIDRNATFACIGAVFGMESATSTKPWITGGNRFIGTVVGGIVGVMVFYIHHTYPNMYLQVILLFVGIIIVILINLPIGVPGAIQGASVVFNIIMLNMPESKTISYAINRMMDTGFGVAMSVFINVIHLKAIKQFGLNSQED